MPTTHVEANVGVRRITLLQLGFVDIFVNVVSCCGCGCDEAEERDSQTHFLPLSNCRNNTGTCSLNTVIDINFK